MRHALGIPLIISLAFVVLVALIVGLALNGILQLRAIDRQFSVVVDNHNRKINVITQTQLASHMRTDSLFRMALSDDPFVRDIYFMDYNRAGFLVGSRRNTLRELGFTVEEQAIFDAQTRLIRRIEAVQDEVITLLQAHRLDAARALFMEQGVPVQQAFNDQLVHMRELYHRSNLAAQARAQRTYRNAFILTLIFGLSAIILALLIAWGALYKVRQYTQRIREQMDELESSRAALREEATHDPLTTLANRRLFYDRLQQAIRHAHRYGAKFGVLYLDLDHFKAINDLHGHHVGDAVLTEVAKKLTASIRESDTVARLGGDEFVVLIEGVTDRSDLYTATRTVEHALASDPPLDTLGVEIGASIGHALYPDDGVDEDVLMRAADASMYRIKIDRSSDRQVELPFTDVRAS